MTPCYPEGMGMQELVIVLVVVVLLFGSSKLPKLARGLGEAQSEFKKGQSAGAKGTKDETPKNDAPQA